MTTPPSTPLIVKFPDCQFETDYCGWEVEEKVNMRWRRTKSQELEEEDLDGPIDDYEGYFVYVGAAEGARNDTAALSTPLVQTPVTGCLQFFFSAAVM